MNYGRILFVDIDGTVRRGPEELGHYVNGPADVQVYPQVPALLRAFKDAGWRIAGASNQGGVALGHTTMEQARDAMRQTQLACGRVFDLIAFCAHHPRAPRADQARCSCRKPGIGMIAALMERLGARFNEQYQAHQCLFVGDRPEDRGCAKNAGLAFLDAAAWRATSPEAVLEGTVPQIPASLLRLT